MQPANDAREETIGPMKGDRQHARGRQLLNLALRWVTEQFSSRGARYLVLAFCFSVATGASLESAAARCPITVNDALGRKKISEVKGVIEKAANAFRRAADAAPDEFAHTAPENLPLLRRADFVEPVWPGGRIYVDAYYGEDFSAVSTNSQIVPKDEFALCTLSSGTTLFLSDGITHHYSVIDEINYASRKVVLLDPWAKVSFLREGRNLVGVRAKVIDDKSGRPLLELSFADLLKVLRGSVTGFNPEVVFAVEEALRPSYATNENYLFWKFTRLLSTNSWQRSFLPTLELSKIAEQTQSSRLKLLASWANDYIVAVESRFSIKEPGRGSSIAEVAKLRSEYFSRLSRYATDLPWYQRWLLLNRAQRSGDDQLYSTTLSAFSGDDQLDVDMLLRHAEFSLASGDLSQAEDLIKKANYKWDVDVTSAIDAPTAKEASDVLFRKDYGLRSLAVLHWRYVRLRLLERLAGMRRGSKQILTHADAMALIQSKYVISSVLTDFFPQVLEDASSSGDFAAVEDYIKTVSGLPDDERRTQIFSRALYKYFNMEKNVEEISAETRRTLRYSNLGNSLCSLGRQFPPRNKTTATHAFAAFCWPKASAIEGRWVTADTSGSCNENSYTFELRDSAKLLIRNGKGHSRTEMISDQGMAEGKPVVVVQLGETTFLSGLFKAQKPRETPQYYEHEPDEGFPVSMPSNQFSSGPLPIFDETTWYQMFSETKLKISSPTGSSRSVTLVRCPNDQLSGANGVTLEQRRTGIPVGAQASGDKTTTQRLLQRAVEIGAGSSKQQAFCGSFFAYSTDSKIDSGELISIKTGEGTLN